MLSFWQNVKECGEKNSVFHDLELNEFGQLQQNFSFIGQGNNS